MYSGAPAVRGNHERPSLATITHHSLASLSATASFDERDRILE